MSPNGIGSDELHNKRVTAQYSAKEHATEITMQLTAQLPFRLGVTLLPAQSTDHKYQRRKLV
jgi:hypothetical protein